MKRKVISYPPGLDAGTVTISFAAATGGVVVVVGAGADFFGAAFGCAGGDPGAGVCGMQALVIKAASAIVGPSSFTMQSISKQPSILMTDVLISSVGHLWTFSLQSGATQMSELTAGM